MFNLVTCLGGIVRILFLQLDRISPGSFCMEIIVLVSVSRPSMYVFLCVPSQFRLDYRIHLGINIFTYCNTRLCSHGSLQFPRWASTCASLLLLFRIISYDLLFVIGVPPIWPENWIKKLLDSFSIMGVAITFTHRKARWRWGGTELYHDSSQQSVSLGFTILVYISGDLGEPLKTLQFLRRTLFSHSSTSQYWEKVFTNNFLFVT